jgi:hypothetical protein
MGEMTEFAKNWVGLKKVTGWLTQEEANFLFNKAMEMKKVEGVIAEIGTFKGRSAIVMAVGSGQKVYCIDPMLPFKLDDGHLVDSPLLDFKENLRIRGVADRVELIQKLSDDAFKEWKLPIKLLFIDGNHNYEYVRRDFDNFVPFVVRGGWVALHDTVDWAGPRKVVAESWADSKVIKVGEISAVQIV